MAILTVGNLVFGMASFHMNEFTVEPVCDDAGLDLQFVKVTLDIVGVVNSYAIASNKATPGLSGSPGDPMPSTVVALRDYLMRRRQYTKLVIGGVTVLESPSINVPLAQMASDAAGGPFPKRASFSQAVGDKTAILQYRVETYVSYCSRYLVSNRWSTRSTVSQDGMTTRTVTGTATFRKDFLDYDDAVADDYRQWLIVPCPSDMRRIHVDALQNPDGASVDYSIVDTEVRYGTGQNSGITKVTGTSSGGCESQIKNATEFVDKFGDLAVDILTGFKGAFKIPGHFNAFIPSSKFAAVTRVHGRKGSDQAYLARVAIAVCLDRLQPVYTPAGGLGFISRLFVTNDHDSEGTPWSMAQVEVWGASPNILFQTLNFQPDTLLKTSQRFDVAATAGSDFGPFIDADRLPASDNTRGTQLTRMVMQALQSPDNACAVPAAPPASEKAQDMAELA